MARKIFISFLGTSKYTECIYRLDSEQSSVVKYIQAALAELFNTEPSDKYYVFTTQKAIDENWQGLQDEIKRLELNVHMENILVPEGQNIDEIWAIFQKIFDLLEEGDELTVDITHSFRHIPLLASALLQYAKFLKNVTVKAIYYGAFETLGPAHEVKIKIPDAKDRIAPIFDLTPFSNIQDWATAANEFISFGSTKQLNKLTQKPLKQIRKNLANSQDFQSQSFKVVERLQELDKSIEKLSATIKTSRGPDIIKGEAAQGIITILDSLEQDLLPALNPILERIKADAKKIFVAQNDARNMLAAVGWCLDKQLIQEGFTILQEGLVTLLLPEKDHNNLAKRDFVTAYLGFTPKPRKEFDRNKFKIVPEEVDTLITSIKSHLGEKFDTMIEIFSGINGIRNDINHAGTGREEGGSMGADKFEPRLREIYDKVKKLVMIP